MAYYQAGTAGPGPLSGFATPYSNNSPATPKFNVPARRHPVVVEPALQNADVWASPGIRAAILGRYTSSRQTVITIADRLGFPPAAVVAVLAAAGISAEAGQPNLYQPKPHAADG
ncbi:hypothetical protein [Actinoplanes flavus]|uniref:Uncharacterized protein n=1 Tax=Actinoplanes flavus TaxID=2820290 RepID=A0ABS3UD50_9ACTN|nr:hypothetical protein [Actinoplanes flavus]MBO3736700.1 hypothetical protein [Actinoplanes flavus]